jgi:heavy metal sensor kinase
MTRFMSIRLRLTLWYSGLLAIVVTIFSLLLYGAVAFNLRNELDAELDAQRDQVQTALLTSFRQRFFGRAPLIIPRDVISTTDLLVQISSTDGNALAHSENLGNASLPRDATLFAAARNKQFTYSTFLWEERERFRLLTAPLTIDQNVVGVIQIASSLRRNELTLNRLALLLIVGSLSAIAIVAVIGYALAGSALKPIDNIIRTARDIARTPDLTQRVHETYKGDEVDRLAITFNEMLGRLENLFRAQQRFIADISHELRTPLTIIRGQLALLQKTAPRDAQAAYDAVEQEAQRMTRLISDLLLLAQSDAGATMLKKETVELDTLMLEVYRQARVMTTGRNGDLRVTLGHEDQALVEGDPDRLKQLLLNLVENAIKYTPSGEIQLAIRKQSGEVGFSVSDTGLGIPSEDVPHIFERFYRVDKARTRAQGGTGLGLSIAQWIAQAHGGRIEVESELGKGSTFTVWLKEKP